MEENKNLYHIRFYPKGDALKDQNLTIQNRHKKKANKSSLDFVRLLLNILQEDINGIMQKEEDGKIE